MANSNYSNDKNKLAKEFLRYFTFWPYFLGFVILFTIIGFIYLRYSTYYYQSNAIIQIKDKSQESEMALPTEMTIFNRSMINLENEIGVLNSYRLHKRSVNFLHFNVKYYSIGVFKTSESHFSQWLGDDSSFKLKVNPDTISKYSKFKIKKSNNILEITHYDDKFNEIKKSKFNNNTTYLSNHDLPFDIKISNLDNTKNIEKEIVFMPVNNVINKMSKLVEISARGSDSDQLTLSLDYPNKLLADEYINSLISEFDKDGVEDRQLEHRRTIEFVDSRSAFLSSELEIIENRRQNYKERNNISEISSVAKITVDQKLIYDSELFNATSQRDLAILLKDAISENNLSLLPINIGIENRLINELIFEYNINVKEKAKYMSTAGKKNTFIINIDNQIENIKENISLSIDNYLNSLNLKIQKISDKEGEYVKNFKDIPLNEKILRSIERELEIKESLFLLLLQKKEEAAINLAVTKPSIKIIDNARSSDNPIFPKSITVFSFTTALSIFLPFLFLYIKFTFDNKFHTREHVAEFLVNFPLLSEIPFTEKISDMIKFSQNNQRNPLTESFRMLSANLKYNLSTMKDKGAEVSLVTSSIKGEGKTIVSLNFALSQSEKYKKVLLIGADLRNPQLHKYIGIKKNNMGLSNLISEKDINIDDVIIKKGNIDIIISGVIPPNPNQLISSNRFEQIFNELKAKYDYIVIDSAPCLIVSDTFELSRYIDTCIYVVRSNFTPIEIAQHIIETKNQNKIPNINIVLNSVGNSRAYGYSYSYQYGYNYGYGYKYGNS